MCYFGRKQKNKNRFTIFYLEYWLESKGLVINFTFAVKSISNDSAFHV